MGAHEQRKRKGNLTAKEVAAKLGVSTRTVVRHVAQARDEWLEENHVQRTKPWLAEGISQATWYRRKKWVEKDGVWRRNVLPLQQLILCVYPVYYKGQDQWRADTSSSDLKPSLFEGYYTTEDQAKEAISTWYENYKLNRK